MKTNQLYVPNAYGANARMMKSSLVKSAGYYGWNRPVPCQSMTCQLAWSGDCQTWYWPCELRLTMRLTSVYAIILAVILADQLIWTYMIYVRLLIWRNWYLNGMIIVFITWAQSCQYVHYLRRGWRSRGIYPDSKVHGANMRPQLGPMLTPWALLSGYILCHGEKINLLVTHVRGTQEGHHYNIFGILWDYWKWPNRDFFVSQWIVPCNVCFLLRG